MQSLALGKSKLLGLTPKRQAKQMALWLRRLWLDLNRGQGLDWAGFYSEYNQVLTWFTLPLPPHPHPEELALGKEFIADQYQYWLQQQDKRLQEEDYLPWGDDLHSGDWQPSHDYWLALDRLRSAFNLGAICRLVDGLGFAGIITSGVTPALTQKGVTKTSLGSELWIPEVRVENMRKTLLQKKSEGYCLIGIEKVDSATPAQNFAWPKRAILVLGNEEYGISQELLSILDHTVCLTMKGRKNSLNVATSFAAVGFLATAHLEASC